MGYQALPRKGTGPGVLVIANAGARRFCDRLAEDDYIVHGIDVGEDADAALGRLAADPAPAVIGIGAGVAPALELARRGLVSAVVVYADTLPDVARAIRVPVAVHVPGEPDLATLAGRANVRAFPYPGVRAGFALSDDPAFNRLAQSVAHSRTLAVLRRVIGPEYDFPALFREHLRHEFVTKDADATMRTMVEAPYVNHAPTMTGGFGHDMLKRFYKYHFIPGQPADRVSTIVSETVGADTVVLETVSCFTHDRVIEHMLPGIEPTGRYVELPIVVIAKFKGADLYYEHIYWDQASLLKQIGLLDARGLPVAGAEEAAKIRDPSLPANELMREWARSAGLPL